MSGEGTVDDFASLWQAHQHQVRCYLARIGVCRGHIDDVLQETAVRAIKGFAHFQGRSQISTWLNTIARNEAIRQLRKNHSMSLHSIPEPHEKPSNRETSEWNYKHAVAEAQRRRLLNDVEAQLIQQRHDAPRNSWGDIGRIFGMSENYCAKTYGRAIQKFRVFLFLHQPDLCGSRVAIEQAFNVACGNVDDPLTAAEAEAFRMVILQQVAEPTARGYWTHLQSACTKVVLRLDRSDDTKVTP
jgi:RNA polymerase sigma-70 factor, ECF subfamily